MRKLILSVALTFLPLLTVAPALAQVDISDNVCSGRLGSGEVPAICQDITSGEQDDPLFGEEGVITRAVNVLSIAAGIIATIVLVVSGIRMALSQGDSQKVAQIRSTIIYAAVGIGVALLAQAAVQVILNNV